MNKGKRGSIPAVFLEVLQGAVYRSMARRYFFFMQLISQCTEMQFMAKEQHKQMSSVFLSRF